MSGFSRAFSGGEHPHVPAGSSAGGQFAPTKGNGNGGNGKKTGAHHGHTGGTAGHGTAPAKPAGPLTKDLAYDPKHDVGPGYGSRDGDPHVHDLQRALNRLGLVDAKGQKLADDGKLGPRTTEAVKAAQRRLGLTPDGKVTPQLYQRLLALKALPAPHKRSAGGDMGMGGMPGGQMDTGDTDSAMEQHLEELLAGLSDDDIRELAALAEAMHADGGQ